MHSIISLLSCVDSFHNFYLFVSLLLTVLGLRCCSGFSPVPQVEAALQLQGAGFSPWLLLWTRALGLSGFNSCSSQALELSSCGLTCSAACSILPGQRSNLCLLLWQASYHWPTREVLSCTDFVNWFLHSAMLIIFLMDINNSPVDSFGFSVHVFILSVNDDNFQSLNSL